jgi:hypothetical protein
MEPLYAGLPSTHDSGRYPLCGRLASSALMILNGLEARGPKTPVTFGNAFKKGNKSVTFCNRPFSTRIICVAGQNDDSGHYPLPTGG